MVLMSSLSQFRNLSLRVFRIWKGAGHSDSFSRGHALSKDSPPQRSRLLTTDGTHQGDWSHCDAPTQF